MSRIPTPCDLARAVVLFWKPGPWTESDADEWRNVTGNEEVHGSCLVDMAKAVLEGETRIDLGPEELTK